MLRMLTPAIGIGLTLSLLLTLTLTFFPPEQVHAQVEPDAPGSIAGVVMGENGALLSGIEVDVLRRDYSSYTHLRTLTTAGNGAYRAGVLSTGTYLLRYRDPAGVYATAYYLDALTLEGATSIPIAGNERTGIDVMLRRAGAVQGAITHTIQSAIAETRIEALAQINGRWQSIGSTQIRATESYSLTGLRPGVYAVCAYSSMSFPSEGGVIRQPAVCFDDVVSTIDNAQMVTVTADITTMDIDLNIDTEGDGATIGGVVRAPGGAPLPAILVYMAQSNQPLGVSAAFGFTESDATGGFKFSGVPIGSYILFFRDAFGPYLTGFYSQTYSLQAATPITVERYEQRLDIEATLALGGVISGTVSILGQETPDTAYVTLYPLDPSEPPLSQSPVVTYDYTTGTYRAAGVVPGAYRVYAYASLSGVSFSGFYRDAPSLAEAEIITVTPGATLDNIDIDLGEGVFDGVIAGHITANGTPFAGAIVSLYHDDSSYRPIVEVTSDATGAYSIGGLTQGVYRLGFHDPAGVYASSFYSNVMAPALAMSLAVAQGEIQTGIDTDLQLGGRIAGRIAMDGDQPAMNYGVQIWYHQNDFFPTLFSMTQRDATDNDGAYLITGLPPGDYIVCAGPIMSDYWMTQGCYGAPLLDTYPDNARRVQVEAGQTTAEINIFLGETLPRNMFLPMLAQ